MNFLKSFLASILGTVVAFIFIGIVFFMAIAGIASTFGTEEALQVEVAENSILQLDLDLPVMDNVASTQEFEKALGLENDVLKFTNVIAAIDKASKDDNIKGIDLQSQSPSMGWSQAQSIRKALNDFKAEGKFVYAFGDYYSQKGYYLASVSDSIFLHPLGGMEFKGLAAEVLYYKDFQEEYGFKMEVVRHGKYKSAVEPYLEREMSEANRSQIQSLLNSVWGTVSEEIEASRSLTSENLKSIAEDLAANLPENSQKVGLIDDLIYASDYKNKLKAALGLEEDDRLRKVDLSQLAGTKALYKKGVRERIAVIYAQGPILYGEGSENIIGQDVFLEAIEDAVKNRRVKAIVLRIDSPGGSALSSDIIWNALLKAKEKKPLVVSMGNVAASGGYYLAAAGDEIYANDLTITGSIGVFATLPNAKKFTESIGINAQHVLTHKNALGFSLFESPSTEFRASIKEGIEHVYDTFKARVAEGRNMSLEEVEEIAQGRVWTGKQALENGLVDGLGGFEQALEAAARLAELEEYNLISYPKIEPEFDDFLSVMGPFGSIEEQLMENYPKEIQAFLTTLINKTERPNIEIRLPYTVEIK
ncbi:MAG: signal peptide peptidase SppA [Flavobacteriaceae bacterium]|nr:signal peptide peptidase SppA [Flavobacteriaceae bacterium]